MLWSEQIIKKTNYFDTIYIYTYFKLTKVI